MREPLVSIIIVNLNGGELLRQCLSSLAKIDYPRWELIVVDNGSTDGSVGEVKNLKLKMQNDNVKFKIIRNSENLGFAVANNQGYEKTKGKYVLLLNNDTTMEPDFLTKLVERMEQDKTLGVVQPKIFLMDEPGLLDNAGSYLTRTGFLVHWGFMQKDSQEFSREAEIFSAKGACMLVRREVIEKVGLFDADFVSYFEESDFCWRVWLAGWRVIYYPQASIHHKLGATSKKFPQTSVHYHSAKNRIASLLKNLDTKDLLIILAPHIFIVFGLGLYYLLRLQPRTAWIFFLAIFWNIRAFPRTVDKRQFVQKLRVKSDEEIFESILRPTNFKNMAGHFKRVEAELGREKFELDIPVKGRVRACLSMVKNQNIKGKVIVDVGCSFGWLQNLIGKDEPEISLGIDPNEKAIEFAKLHVKGAEFLAGEAQKMQLPTSFADVVCFFDVLEHLPRGTELAALREIKRILKPGGVLLLSTPNWHPLANAMDPVWYFGHRHYRRGQVKKLLRKSGLRVVSAGTHAGVASLFYMIWFYLTKWLFGQAHPRSRLLEELDDRSYNRQKGFVVHLVVAQKND